MTQYEPDPGVKMGTSTVGMLPDRWRRAYLAAVELTSVEGPYFDPVDHAARVSAQKARDRTRRWISHQRDRAVAGDLPVVQKMLMDNIPADWRERDLRRQQASRRAELNRPELGPAHDPAWRSARGERAGAASAASGRSRGPQWLSEQGRRNGTGGRETRRAAMATRAIPIAVALLAGGDCSATETEVLRVRIQHPEESTAQLGARLEMSGAAYNGRLRRLLRRGEGLRACP
ncbi:hypothetical protein Adu01nite_47930 [Paractinoplanes durhamensis]|uniref:Uncharacterized protein n=1 Tax=Paractinoplanes durhamensis TaxID=113563 RepID=A0ABQ3Z0V2_9ACTN|nr:hypothetical protein Adu01nite_47930 [Actinoplanes durhamensis]